MNTRSNSNAEIPLLTGVARLADRAAAKPDRWWLAFLMLLGICGLGLMLHWHREDQRAMADLFTTTLRQNSEALVRCTVALEHCTETLERAERTLSRSDRP
jgi:hypothetical protein